MENRYRLLSLFGVLASHACQPAIAQGVTSLEELLQPGSELSRAVTSPALRKASLFHEGSAISVEPPRAAIEWLFPTRPSDGQVLLPNYTPVIYSPSNPKPWTKWLDSLGAEAENTPAAWAQWVLEEGEKDGRFDWIGDSILVRFSRSDINQLHKRDPLYWSTLELPPGESPELFGSIQLLYNELKVSLTKLSGGKIDQVRTEDVRAVVRLAPESPEEKWALSLEALKDSEFMQSVRSEQKLYSLFDGERQLETANRRQNRISLSNEYAKWQSAVSTGLGNQGLASVSLVEAIRLTQGVLGISSQLAVPWSTVPESTTVATRPLIRIRRNAWQPTLNEALAITGIRRKPGLLTLEERAQVAEMIGESPMDDLSASVLALGLFPCGQTLSSSHDAFALRVLNLYRCAVGKHSPMPAMGKLGLINSLLQSSSQLLYIDRKLVSPAVFSQSIRTSMLKEVEISRYETPLIGLVGGNEQYPFMHRTNMRSVDSIGRLLGELFWTTFRLDDFDAIQKVEVSYSEVSQVQLDLKFGNSVATSILDSGNPSPSKQLPISALDSDLRENLQSAFNAGVKRAKLTTDKPA